MDKIYVTRPLLPDINDYISEIKLSNNKDFVNLQTGQTKNCNNGGIL